MRTLVVGPDQACKVGRHFRYMYRRLENRNAFTMYQPRRRRRAQP